MTKATTIKKKLEKVFDEKQANVLTEVIIDSYEELVKTSDFNELKEIVKELAVAQRGSEKRLTGIETVMEELAEAQKKTEFRVEELVEAQKKTEIRVEELAEAQKKTEIRVEELAGAQKKTEIRVEELAGAQKKTEFRVEELAGAQKKTEFRVDDLAKTMQEGFKSLSDQIAALGSRWGIYNESTFRSTIKGILSKQKGVEVTSGYYGDREVDVIIRDGEHIILEITSRMKASDINKIMASADDYKMQHNIEPILMVATSYISPKLMQKIISLPKKIDIFSYEEE